MKKEATSNEKITEALKLLEEAAKDKKHEIAELISSKYKNLKTAVSHAEESVKDSVELIKKRATEAAIMAKDVGTEKTIEIAKSVDENVHRNPWPYIGGIAVGSLLLGYILGRKQ